MALSLVLAGVACDSDDPQPDAGDDSGISRNCQHDDLLGPSSAVDLVAGEGDDLTAEGFICPVADTDWYRLTVPDGHHLLRIALSVTGPGSPIQPTYAVYQCDEGCVADPPTEGEASCCDARATPRPDEVSDEVEVLHCIDPGDYYIVVRDQGSDSQDDREPRGIYNLTVSTAADADPAEPNDGPDTAAAPTSEGGQSWSARGQIACRGDQDWYLLDSSTGITIGPNDLLEVELTVPIAEFQPQYRILREEGDSLVTVGTERNLSGTAEPTDLGELYWLEGSGRHFVVIEDDDGDDADPGATYDVTIRLVHDEDDNEPNNTPDDATDLGSPGCVGSWSTPLRETGTLSASNDVDFFRVVLDAACAGGVLEAEVEFDSTPPEGLEPQIRIVRAHPETTCTERTQCGRLQIECDSSDIGGLDCSGFGNNCLGDGLCAGASLCLPGGSCGATVIARAPDWCDRGQCQGPLGAIPGTECAVHSDCGDQSHIATAIPIGRNPQGAPSAVDQLFIEVSDFRGGGRAPSLTYTLTVRTRSDPDVNEPNERYNPLLSDESGTFARDLATPVGADGCLEGRLSYERDQDWFALPHPCPGTGGCTLRVNYSISSGPVEVLAFARGAWDNITEYSADSDPVSNTAHNGTRGGASECFPANDNLSDPIYVLVRDFDRLREWDPDQTYRICFETPDAGCNPPCQVLSGQCWYPPEE